MSIPKISLSFVLRSHDLRNAIAKNKELFLLKMNAIASNNEPKMPKLLFKSYAIA
ncbi:MAG: hypothetical protein AAGA60_22765 [Cyanobacteria bacterium P01_E01_bin.42]